MNFDIGAKALIGLLAICGTLCWITWLTYRSRIVPMRKRKRSATPTAGDPVERSGQWRSERTERPSL